MKQYGLYYTVCNRTTGNFIFEEDEKEICYKIAKDLSKSKKYTNIQIFEYEGYHVNSIKEK